ncbi:hypothetical protein E5K00_13375 [Hymenobacter aquaticus]|uniref:STAS/SEC14 domain-containing protein n=1 Tax=Hymenobacter aquaticus TaxID=1867101 RepID=A0A4Z0PVF6_9BACT|nr:hypothetical protein [Hymenobacter aquaticus]TGE21279.1 hypothetical protein E5K00_13375 [Hymenobacter aquaticus]
MPNSRALKLYFENTAARLTQDPNGFLRVRWTSKARRLEETQAVFTHMRLALERFGWSRILIDQTAMLPFTTAEQQWISQQWLPRAVQEGGYRHGAVVVSPEVMVRLATSYITTQVLGLPLVYRSFEHETEAVQWLLSQPAAPLG